MASPPRVAILVHRHQGFQEESYFLGRMAEFWRAWGVEVLVLRDPREHVPADLAILHVDLTVIPSEYLAWVHRFPRCLNRYTSDISKRAVSRQLVRTGDGWAGPVIVKSNLNCGGGKEHELALKMKVPSEVRLVSGEYPILESAAQVAPWVWQDSSLVVERFLPERCGEEFCLRTWVFFGDKFTHSICYSDNPVIKSANVLRREPLGEVPETLAAVREELGFDYGKFDYALVDGGVVLYDANRTPTVGRSSNVHFTQDQVRERLRLLAEGLCSYLPIGGAQPRAAVGEPK